MFVAVVVVVFFEIRNLSNYIESMFPDHFFLKMNMKMIWGYYFVLMDRRMFMSGHSNFRNNVIDVKDHT